MKILHVASFKGNIGDIANHFGFRGWFESFFQEVVSWHEFEIRHVFRREAKFDQSFVELANQFDLVVIGGGNFFELWVESSPTGTSISIERKHLNKISTPIFVNSVGVDDGLGVTDETLLNFNLFLEALVTSQRCLVSVRNDGAYANLQKYVTKKHLLEHILALPDGGFFAKLNVERNNCYSVSSPVIGVNLAGDMPDTRFKSIVGCHNYDSFLEEFSEFLKITIRKQPNVRFVFFPHIYSDLKIISNLFEILPDEVRREYCSVGIYDSNTTFEKTVFNAYLNCDLVLGMRFHANVLAIANGISVIGLNCYKQIQSLYEELGAPEYCVNVKQVGFHKQLLELTEQCIAQPKGVTEKWKAISNKVFESKEVTARNVYSWLSKQNFKLSKFNA